MGDRQDILLLSCCCSVTKSHLTLQPHGLYSTPSLPVPHHLLEFTQVHVKQWCYPTISSSAILFSFCLQSFPASGTFPMSLLFASGGQSIGASASASVFPMSIQGWFPLGLTGLISLRPRDSQESSPTPQFKKHQFFGAQLSSQSNSHIHTWLLEKP